jgi:hypothetical protein
VKDNFMRLKYVYRLLENVARDIDMKKLDTLNDIKNDELTKQVRKFANLMINIQCAL